MIKVQSGVAAHLARKRGEEVPEVLAAIQEAAGDAALELRETLGILRRDASTMAAVRASCAVSSRVPVLPACRSNSR